MNSSTADPAEPRVREKAPRGRRGHRHRSDQSIASTEEEPSSPSEDNVLIEKLHERSCQPEPINQGTEDKRQPHREGRYRIRASRGRGRSLAKSSCSWRLSHAQHQQAKEEEYRAKENSWRVQPMAPTGRSRVQERLALEDNCRTRRQRR